MKFWNKYEANSHDKHSSMLQGSNTQKYMELCAVKFVNLRNFNSR